MDNNAPVPPPMVNPINGVQPNANNNVSPVYGRQNIPGRDGTFYIDYECYYCHDLGHYANNCPKRNPVSSGNFRGRGRGRGYGNFSNNRSRGVFNLDDFTTWYPEHPTVQKMVELFKDYESELAENRFMDLLHRRGFTFSNDSSNNNQNNNNQNNNFNNNSNNNNFNNSEDSHIFDFNNNNNNNNNFSPVRKKQKMEIEDRKKNMKDDFEYFVEKYSLYCLKVCDDFEKDDSIDVHQTLHKYGETVLFDNLIKFRKFLWLLCENLGVKIAKNASISTQTNVTYDYIINLYK